MSFSICLVGFRIQARKMEPFRKESSKIFLIPYHRIRHIINKDFCCSSCLSTSEVKSRWKEPDGYYTGIKIYNTLTKSKVPLKTIYPNILTWYNCGPTVYDSSHIGHGSTFVKLDIVRRILENYFKLQVVQVTNVTDIDDKIITKSRQLNENVKSVSLKYEDEFHQDMQRLNVMPPSITTRVTDFIPEIISFIQKLVDDGHAYSNQGDVYFDTVAYKNYGKFFQATNDPQTYHRIWDDKKRCPKDFALWKSATEEPNWNSPWGQGRPGWHIECSTMAYQIFGEKLDLHSGGIDLMFPHHENEDAQCCAHHNTDQWCNYWLHTGHLHIKGSSKMSKSLKNTISINELLEQYSSNLFRFFCLLSHYRKSQEYTDELMLRTEARMNKIVAFLQFSHAYLTSQICCGVIDDQVIINKMAEVKANVAECFADDFNTEGAVLQILDLITVCNKYLTKTSKVNSASRSLSTVSLVSEFIYNFFLSLGVQFRPYVPSVVQLAETDKQFSHLLNATIQFRQKAKNFALMQGDYANQDIGKEEKKSIKDSRKSLLEACDQIRGKLHNHGIVILDHEGTSSWSYMENKPERVASVKKVPVKKS